MQLSDILHEGEYLSLSDPSVLLKRVEGIASDSRRIGADVLFVSLRGIHTDGAFYIGQSERMGACAVICESPPTECHIPYIVVKDARKALSLLLYRFWGSSGEKMDLYAVTGTNGKTSSCWYLREIFISAGIKTGYIGTLKSYIDHERLSLGIYDNDKMSTMTTPDPEQLYRILYEMYRAGVKKVIIEASSHALQLDKLAPLRFRAGIFTNFSPEHLDFHSSMDDYLRAKCKLFSLSDKMYLNADDSVCRSLVRDDIPCLLWGEDERANTRAVDIAMHGTEGVSYTVLNEKESFKVHANGIGRFTVYNSLCATALALGEGISPEHISQGIASVRDIRGRLEKLELGEEYRELTVIIDYAHTEKALAQLLCAVSEIRKEGQRIVTLFGCGGDRDKSKRSPMGRCASYYSDVVVITEDNSRSEDVDSIISDIMQGIDTTKEYKIIKNRKKAIEFVIKNARKDDIILLVGKGHEEYEITNNIKSPFSEKKIVYEILGIGSAEV